MFLIVKGLRSTKGVSTEATDTAHCFVTDNYHEGLGKHSASLFKLNLQRNSTVGHKLLLG